jgi:phosphohistidine swiveling domain-containing protein
VVYVIPVITTAGQELKEMAYSARAKTQAHNESFEPIIKGFLEKEYPQLKEKTRFVLPAEVWSGQVKNPDYLEEIKAREKGFIFYQGKLYCGQSIEQMADELGLELKEAVNAKSVAGLTGQIAQKGLVKGEVRLVSSLKDLDKVKDGDILVATNTMPKYLPAMKRAAAFVTDEGGITCHAAIVAREMKKPCVIGTKIATQVLHDGDLVEVDADNGVVKILGK